MADAATAADLSPRDPASPSAPLHGLGAVMSVSRSGEPLRVDAARPQKHRVTSSRSSAAGGFDPAGKPGPGGAAAAAAADGLPMPASRMSAAERFAMKRAEADRLVQNDAIDAPWRVWVFRNVVSRHWFDTVVLLAILANCVTLALANPSSDSDDPVIVFTERAELAFLVLFTAEMLLKFVALGLFHEHGYFRDPWNRLDFVIVVSGYVSLLPGVSNITAVRILRVLRPLRAVNNLPGLRVIVRTLLSSMRALGDVAVLLSFLFVIFAIVGLQLWNGSFRQRCYAATDTAFASPGDDLCSGTPGGFQCASDEVCAAEGPAPSEGLVGFDNIGQAVLTVFTTATLSDWTTTMFATMDVSSDYAVLYYVALVLFLSYFAVNLVLAVVSDVFGGLSDESNAEAAEVRREQRDARIRARRRESVIAAHTSMTEMASRGGGAGGDDSAESSRVSSRAPSGSPPPPLSPMSPNMSPPGRVSSAGVRRARSLGSVPEELLARSDVTEEELFSALDEHASSVRARAMDELRGSIDEVRAPLARKRCDSFMRMPDLETGELVTTVAPVLDEAIVQHDQEEAYLSRRPPWVRRVFRFVSEPWFSRVIVALILANTVTLALEHHRMSESLESTLYRLNIFFTVAFTAEAVLKIIGMGPRGYARDSFNVFDAFVVLVSLVELVALSGGAVSVFRTFRLLRVLRLAKSQKSLRILLDTVMASLSSVGYMTIILGLFLYMFAVLGLQLFSGKWENIADPEERPRSSFDNFYWAFITVFQLTTGDDWTGLMTSTVQATGTQVAIVYFIIVTVFGSFIVLNLFVAILLQQFDSQDEDQHDVDDLEEHAHALVRDEAFEETAALRSLAERLARARLDKFDAAAAKEAELRALKRPARIEGRALGLFGRESALRRFCWALVHTWQFQYFIVFAILLNCVLLAMENPGVESDSGLGRALAIFDYSFAALFAAEMLLKWVAFGVYKGQRAYFRDRWNALDAFVVATALVSLFFPAFSVVRSFRALRPLRVVVRSNQIRIVLTSLYRALPAIANVALFCGIFWAIFGILGVSLFAGLFYSCDGDASLDRAECEAAGFEWRNAETHFDNLGASVVTLFQVGTLSGWADVMYLAIDATAVDKAPRRNAQPQAALFFIAFIVICGFFTLNLFLGVVVDNFQRLKEEVSGSAFLTEEQRLWVATRKLLSKLKLDASLEAPSGALRRACFRVVTHPWFDPFIIAAIVLNVLVMMTESFRQPDGASDAQLGFNLFFIALFALEAALKIAAYGFPVYWKDSWNRFDFVIVVASFLGLAVDAGVGASVVRVFRLGRVLRLINRAKTLKQMFETLLLSLPALVNIALLLVVLLFIFAVLGVEFFGRIELGDDPPNRDLNFRDFGHAMLTLFVLVAGDAWEEVLFGARDESRGGSSAAPVYFVLYMVLASMVLIELYVAVVLENFSVSGEEVDGDMRENLDKMEQFSAAWARLDPLATQRLPARDIEKMMSAAPLPFGFGRRLPRSRVFTRLRQANIPIRRRRRPPSSSAVRGIEWYAEFRPTLERVARSLTLGEQSKREGGGGGAADDDDDESGGADGEVEDVWECSKRSRNSCCWRVREDRTVSTMAEYYLVQTLEVNYMLRTGRLDRRDSEFFRGYGTSPAIDFVAGVHKALDESATRDANAARDTEGDDESSSDGGGRGGAVGEVEMGPIEI